MSGIRRPSFFTPSPSNYARDAIATIGIQEITYGTLAHAIQVCIKYIFIINCVNITDIFDGEVSYVVLPAGDVPYSWQHKKTLNAEET